MAGVPQPTERFKRNLNDFFTHVISIVKERPDKFVTVKSVEALRDLLAEYPMDTTMVLFINYTQGNWGMVKERNPAFFQNFQNVLRQIPVREISNSNLLHDIMTKSENGKAVVSPEKLNIMWEYCESFIYILVDYVHKTRGPKTRILANGAKQAVYSVQFLPQFNIRDHCKTWSIDLVF